LAKPRQRLVEGLADRLQALVEQAGEAAVDERGHQPAERDPAQQQHGAGELLAARDIAFLARVADLLLGRFLGLVGALVLVGHAKVPWLSSTRPEASMRRAAAVQAAAARGVNGARMRGSGLGSARGARR